MLEYFCKTQINKDILMKVVIINYLLILRLTSVENVT